MDIYMRRRLVALGGLVAFFILFVLLVKSCGGDDEPEAPLTPVGATGEEGAAPLSKPDFIQQADSICAQANNAVGAIDPAASDATRDEFQITRDEVQQLQGLEVEQQSGELRRFMGLMGDLVNALRDKNAAIQDGDTVAEGEAQLAIDTAEADARELGESYGFSDCGQFLDAGEAPGGGGAEGAGAETPPADTGTEVPQEGTEAPPADTAPPDDTTQPPPDDTGGVTP